MESDELITRLNLELGNEALMLFQEMKMKYQATSEALMKVAFTMLYEVVCIYPKADGWKIMFSNNDFPDRNVVVDLMSSTKGDARKDMFSGSLNQTESILIDPQTAVVIQELINAYGSNTNLMLQQALSLLTSVTYQYSHKEGWTLLACSDQHSPRTIESQDALISLNL